LNSHIDHDDRLIDILIDDHDSDTESDT